MLDRDDGRADLIEISIAPRSGSARTPSRPIPKFALTALPPGSLGTGQRAPLAHFAAPLTFCTPVRWVSPVGDDLPDSLDEHPRSSALALPSPAHCGAEEPEIASPTSFIAGSLLSGFSLSGDSGQ